VLESRHVIGLFMLMLLFSGVFFTLGYLWDATKSMAGARRNDFFGKPGNSFFQEGRGFQAREHSRSCRRTRIRPRPEFSWEFYHAARIKKPKTI